MEPMGTLPDSCRKRLPSIPPMVRRGAEQEPIPEGGGANLACWESLRGQVLSLKSSALSAPVLQVLDEADNSFGVNDRGRGIQSRLRSRDRRRGVVFATHVQGPLRAAEVGA